MGIFKIYSKCCFALVFIVMTSCAAWRSQDVVRVENFKGEVQSQERKLKTHVKLSLYEVSVNNELDKDEMSSDKLKQVLSLSKKAYDEAGIFDLVEGDSPNKELVVDISILRKKESSLTSDILTAATLYLVPKRTNEEITVTTKFLDNKGELIGMVEKVETVVVWHQFFMLFALPFNIPSNVKEETLVDLSRSTILEALSEGHFVELNDKNIK